MMNPRRRRWHSLSDHLLGMFSNGVQRLTIKQILFRLRNHRAIVDRPTEAARHNLIAASCPVRDLIGIQGDRNGGRRYVAFFMPQAGSVHDAEVERDFANGEFRAGTKKMKRAIRNTKRNEVRGVFSRQDAEKWLREAEAEIHNLLEG